MKRIRRLLQGRSKGLTLVEIVIAMALIAIIGVGFLGGLSQAMFSLHIADVRTTAESLARSEMEAIKSEPYRPAPWDGDPEKKFEGYTITASAEALDDPETPEKENLQEITVTVTHHDRGLVVTLIGYRSRR